MGAGVDLPDLLFDRVSQLRGYPHKTEVLPVFVLELAVLVRLTGLCDENRVSAHVLERHAFSESLRLLRHFLV